MKRIWILGAGASIGHSKGEYPSINGFFSKGRELGITSTDEGTTKKGYGEVGDYIDEIFGKNILDKSQPINIEEVLTYLEIDIEKLKTLKLINMRQQLLELVKDVLDGLSKRIPKGESEYHYLVGLLNKKDTIITFNWDLLLDNIFGRETFSKDVRVWPVEGAQQYANMMEEFVFVEPYLDKPYSQYDSSRGYYLKLHGSIDWVYCPNEVCHAFAHVFPIVHYRKQHYCSKCHQRMEHLLIAPVANKGYKAYPFIRKIWNAAMQEVQASKEIIIWGYSLPPTDFYSFWLLRHTPNSLDKYILINPRCIRRLNGNNVTWSNKFLKPFFEILRNKVHGRLMEFYETFTDYRNGKSIRQEYGLGFPRDI